MTPIEQIKAEIERQRIMYGKDGWKGIATVMSDLLSFIESLEKKEAQEEIPRHKQTQGSRPFTSCSGDKDTNNKPKIQGLDEAARYYEEHRGQALNSDNKECRRAFKAGAEWMAGQGVEAYCITSFNPASEFPDKPLHGIEIIYEEIDGMPYVLAGDKIVIQIRKK